MTESGEGQRGYFAVGIVGGKTPKNLGTLWRTASLFDAAFVFTVGARYEKQPTDTTFTERHIPLFHFGGLIDLLDHLPASCLLVGVELAARAWGLRQFVHPERAAYLLGAEDAGLPDGVLQSCNALVQVESAQPWSMNVAVAGSIVLHDRYCKGESRWQPIPA